MIKKIINIKALFAAFVLMAPFQASQAAILDVTSLSVDTLSANLTIGSLGSTGGSTSIMPPALITMGSYQDPILSFSDSFGSGTFEASIYTSAIGGAAAPSASVDTLAGNFASIDLESLRIGAVLTTGLGTYSFDNPFWPFNTTPTGTLYDPMNGDFSLTWAFNDVVSVYNHNLGSYFDLNVNFDVSLSGQAAAVPLPAAIWLFVSGLLAVVGFVRKRP